MKTNGWHLVMFGALVAMAGLFGCTSHGTGASRETATSVDPADPTARTFKGTIFSLRYEKGTMLISKDEHVGNDAFPNVVEVHWDQNTKIYMDGAPSVLEKIEQYMPVTIEGHMRDGRLIADSAWFKSELPANVRRAEAKTN